MKLKTQDLSDDEAKEGIYLAKDKVGLFLIKKRKHGCYTRVFDYALGDELFETNFKCIFVEGLEE